MKTSLVILVGIILLIVVGCASSGTSREQRQMDAMNRAIENITGEKSITGEVTEIRQ